MNILITGATGFIGRYITAELLRKGNDIIVITRNKRRAGRILGDKIQYYSWRELSNDVDNHIDIVINLAGAGISDKRWSRKRKKKIINSRTKTSEQLVDFFMQAGHKPDVFIQASAIGYYGPSDNELDETSSMGKGFLAETTAKWEKSVSIVNEWDTRLVFVRTGIVLGRTKGFLPRFLKPFKYFMGGYPGSGKQWISWIHVADEVNAILFCIDNDQCEGIYNLSAPNPVTMADFCRLISKTVNKPCWIRIPGILLRLFMGQMAQELILSGQKVLPVRLNDENFNFRFKHPVEAIDDLLC